MKRISEKRGINELKDMEWTLSKMIYLKIKRKKLLTKT
jgi:hypothetical protein